MRASSILKQSLGDWSKETNRRRWRSVLEAADAVVEGGRATLTDIGRSLDSATTAKHRIKRADRLLGNPRLQAEIPTLYMAIAGALLSTAERPVILLDWTELSNGWMALCAAVPFQRRAIPIYSEVHSKKRFGGYQRLYCFLRQLRGIIPTRSRPIIVADAGFTKTFFEACFDTGFDFVVRLRGNAFLRSWRPDREVHAKDLFSAAGKQPHLNGRFSVYDRAHRGLTLNVIVAARPRKMRRRRSSDTVYQRRACEPWVLATSLADEKAVKIVALYARRMQIEEAFRDAKDPRYGWSLAHAGNRSAARFEVLLLVTSLAMFAVMLLGLTAEIRGWVRWLQANTIRDRRVLSAFSVGVLLLAELRRHRPLQR